MIIPGPIGVAVARLVDVANLVQARLPVTHDAQDARPIRLQHVDNCDPDASAKDLRPAMPSPRGNGPRGREPRSAGDPDMREPSPDQHETDIRPERRVGARLFGPLTTSSGFYLMDVHGTMARMACIHIPARAEPRPLANAAMTVDSADHHACLVHCRVQTPGRRSGDVVLSPRAEAARRSARRVPAPHYRCRRCVPRR
jgi:hypothetical protein